MTPGVPCGVGAMAASPTCPSDSPHHSLSHRRRTEGPTACAAALWVACEAVRHTAAAGWASPR
eukprot:2423759-Prymnesium_polylepis.1